MTRHRDSAYFVVLKASAFCKAMLDSDTICTREAFFPCMLQKILTNGHTVLGRLKACKPPAQLAVASEHGVTKRGLITQLRADAQNRVYGSDRGVCLSCLHAGPVLVHLNGLCSLLLLKEVAEMFFQR
jgi:hypothetical protein